MIIIITITILLKVFFTYYKENKNKSPKISKKTLKNVSCNKYIKIK